MVLHLALPTALRSVAVAVLLLGCMAMPEPKNGAGNKYVPSAAAPTTPTISTNSPPLVAANQTISLNEDTATSFTVSAATDEENNTLYYYIVGSPFYGTLTNCMDLTGSAGLTDRTCTYTPPSNVNGNSVDFFTYRVYDGTSYSVIFARIYFNITAVNDNPTITAIADQTINEGSSVSTVSTTVDEGGGTYENSQTLKVRVTSSNSSVVDETTGIVVKWGGVTLSQSGTQYTLSDSAVDASSRTLTIVATPASTTTANGSTNITVEVSDDGGGTWPTSDVYSLTVSEVNAAPEFLALNDVTLGEGVAVNTTVSVDEGASDSNEDTQTTTLTITSGNTTAVPNANILINAVDNSENNAAGAGDDSGSAFTLAITPASATYNGTVMFTATLSDGTNTTTSTFNVTWSANNDSATISNVTLGNYTINEDASISNHELNIDEGGASDEDVDGLIVCLSSSDTTLIPVANIVPKWNGSSLSCVAGACSVGDSTFDADLFSLYLDITPAANENGGPATITVGIDDDGDCTAVDNSATFTVTVTSVLDDPTMTVSNQTVAEGAAASFNVTIDAGGSTDEAGETITLSLSSGNTSVVDNVNDMTVNGSNISAAGLADGATVPIVITPNTNSEFSGTITFTATLTDTGGETATQTFDVTWTAVDDAPAIAATYSTTTPNEDTAFTATLTVDEDAVNEATEDTQSGTIIVSSSDTSIIDPADITATWGGNSLSNSSGSINVGDGSTDLSDNTVILTINPKANANGPVNLTIGIDDDQDGTADTTLGAQAINVTSVEDNPTIAALNSKTTNRDTGVYGIALSLDEGGGTAEDTQALSLTIASSNTTLIPYANIRMKMGSTYATSSTIAGLHDGATPIAIGEAGDASLTANTVYLDFVPATNQTGSATITVTVSDANGTPQAKNFTIVVNNIYATHGKWTAITAKGRTVKADGTVSVSAPTTSFTWNDFTYFNGTAGTTWYVYRSDDGSSEDKFDYTNPIGTTTSRSFTDTTLTSSDAGKVYWYQVRPVVNSIITGNVDTTFNSLRIVVPPDNMALIHRWAANIIACGKISATTDATNNFRCSYDGPGNIAGPYYDFSTDLLVDKFEFGCNYGSTTACDENGSLGCFGMNNTTPTVDTDAANGTLFYDRGNGYCYVMDTGAWSDISTHTVMAPLDNTNTAFMNGNAPGLPPLTNVTQAQANSVCGVMETTIDNAGATTTYNKRLLTRREQFMGAQWSTSYSNSTINTYETGSSLSSSYACNTNGGDGLTFSDTASATPSSLGDLKSGTSTVYGTIKLLSTGSSYSSNCTSLWGLQDMVGNAGEWVNDRVLCTTDYSCQAVSSLTNSGNRLNNINDWVEASSSADYAFDGATGPYSNCTDTTPADGACDTTTEQLLSWLMSDLTYDAQRIYLPLGLPASSTSNGSALPTSTIISASGIATSNLHSDVMGVWALRMKNAASNTGGMITGGDYTWGGNSAGMFSFEFDDIVQKNKRTGFRCAVPVP